MTAQIITVVNGVYFTALILASLFCLSYVSVLFFPSSNLKLAGLILLRHFLDFRSLELDFCLDFKHFSPCNILFKRTFEVQGMKKLGQYEAELNMSLRCNYKCNFMKLLL